MKLLLQYSVNFKHVIGVSLLIPVKAFYIGKKSCKVRLVRIVLFGICEYGLGVDW